MSCAASYQEDYLMDELDNLEAEAMSEDYECMAAP